MKSLILAVALVALCVASVGAAPVTANTPIISLDRVYPYLAFEQVRQFDQFEASKTDPAWHGNAQAGTTYVLSDQFNLNVHYALGLKGDPNFVSVKLVLKLRQEN